MRAFRRFALIALALAPPGGATIIFNNLSTNGIIPAGITTPGGVQVHGSAYGGVNNCAAGQFTPNQDYDLTEFNIVIGNNGGPGNAKITLNLYSDSGGVPGSQLGGQSWSFVGPNNIIQVTSVAVSNLRVSSGIPYWLVALPGDIHTTTFWAVSSVPLFQGKHAIGVLPGGSWMVVDSPQNYSDWAFAVQGTAASVPEPASAVLTLLGALALLKKSRKNWS